MTTCGTDMSTWVRQALHEEFDAGTYVIYRHVDIDKTPVRDIVSRLEESAKKFERRAANTLLCGAQNVVVFDLDRTIVDDCGDLLSDTVVQWVERVCAAFDMVVLWSHGDSNHVQSVLQRHPRLQPLFHTVITRNPIDTYTDTFAKGTGTLMSILNDRHNMVCMGYVVLVDDQPLNYTDDYDEYICIPDCTGADMERVFRSVFPPLLCRLQQQQQYNVV